MPPTRIRDVRPQDSEAARDLRRQETSAEQRLWQALRDRQLGGLKFRRQHAVGPYILDFYCPAYKLVVELDGSGHETAEQIEYDAARTDHLAGYGYHVIRFPNDAVLHQLEQVLTDILAAVESPNSPHPGASRRPSPNAGRGYE